MASAAQPAEMPRSDVYIARQPIFKTQSNIYAYELLNRSSMNNWYQSDDDVASLSVLSNSAFVFGMESMIGGGKAFVNFTRGTLLNDYARVFPAQKLVVEVLEGVEVDADVRAACIRLKNKGYTLALDDWDPNGATGSLVDLADIIKIDFPMFDRDMRR
jgi:c-di-GMP-related signal transduction protein